jgi:hypothetical protein
VDQHFFAAAYGEGDYGECNYQSTTSCATASGSTGSGTSGSGGTLTNTGIAIAVIITLACIIIFVSLVVRIWRRKKTPELAPVEVLSDDDSSSER